MNARITFFTLLFFGLNTSYLIAQRPTGRVYGTQHVKVGQTVTYRFSPETLRGECREYEMSAGIQGQEITSAPSRSLTVTWNNYGEGYVNGNGFNCCLVGIACGEKVWITGTLKVYVDAPWCTVCTSSLVAPVNLNSSSTQSDTIIVDLEEFDNQTNVLNEDLNLYPNPASSYLHINHSHSRDIKKIYIKNIQGEKVFERQFKNDSDLHIDLSSIEQGVYFVFVEKGQGILRKRIHVQK